MASSKSSHFTERSIVTVVRDQLSQLIPNCHSVGLAYSGGLDSTCLLHILIQIRAELDLDIQVFHVNHHLSPNSETWAEFAAKQCSDYGVSFSILDVHVDVSSGDGIELAARKARYLALDTQPVSAMLLAQHQDDQAETILLNLCRGAGIRGAAGMPPILGKYVRPLLSVGRAELVVYAKKESLTWIEDESNENIRFTRNYLRHMVFPLLAERFPAVGTRLSQAAQHFSEAQGLLDELAVIDLEGAAPQFPVSDGLLMALSTSRAVNLIRYLLAESELQSPSSVRLSEWIRQVREAGLDKHPSIDFSGYRLIRTRKQIHLLKNISETDKSG